MVLENRFGMVPASALELLRLWVTALSGVVLLLFIGGAMDRRGVGAA